MFFVSKSGWAGIAFTLLTTGMLLQGFPRSAAGSDSNKKIVAAFVVKNEIKKVQETLRDKGHYRGKCLYSLGIRWTRDKQLRKVAEALSIHPGLP